MALMSRFGSTSMPDRPQWGTRCVCRGVRAIVSRNTCWSSVGKERRVCSAATKLRLPGGGIKANGPPPSQTLLLITSPHALESTDRAALIDRISNVPGPRRVPPDSQILWQTNKPERLVSATSARGEVDLDWPGLVKAELERVPNLRFSGRSFAVALADLGDHPPISASRVIIPRPAARTAAPAADRQR